MSKSASEPQWEAMPAHKWRKTVFPIGETHFRDLVKRDELRPVYAGRNVFITRAEHERFMAEHLKARVVS